jgi:hypothetical protein
MLFVFAVESRAQIAPQTTFYFPQVAVGSGGGLEYSTAIVLTNPAASSATGSFSLMTDAGTPLQGIETERVPDGPRFTVATIPFTLAPLSTSVWIVEALNNGPLTTGWAVVSTAASAGGNGVAISGVAVFEFEVDNSDQEDAVGVGASGLSNELVTPAVTGAAEGLRTGVAVGSVVANTLTFTYINESGTTLYTSQRTVPANGHLALFVDQVFPGFTLGSGNTPAIGTLRITATAPMAALAIQFFGLEMTTFPVIRVN